MASFGGRDFSRYLPLYNAAVEGEWLKAKTEFFDKDENDATAIISFEGETALHVAVQSVKANDFVKKLVEFLPLEELERQDLKGYTALHSAAMVGNTEAARAMVEKNPDLLYMLADGDLLPVTVAAAYRHMDTLKYLISASKPNVKNSPFQGKLGIELLTAIIVCEFFVVAMELVEKYPDLARLKYGDRCALSYIAEMDTVFLSRESFSWWEKLIYRCIPEATPTASDVENASVDTTLASNKCSGLFQIIYGGSKGRNIMHFAATNRFENVFNLTYNMSNRKHLFSNGVDSDGNNLMHMCAKLAPSRRLNLVPGAALQMQRELQWFNEMEKFVPASRRKWVNKEGKTPKMLFTEEHQQLKAEGERWMKDTDNACTIAAALIATVMFAAAFTVPGGVASETGIPIFSGNSTFVLFAISDAVSLFTSITSLLMFLSILTSRYAEGDFLYVLPKRLSIGLFTLFVSITFMLAAFGSTLCLVFRGKAWFIIPVAVFACLPVASFVMLQFPLLADVVYSTYGLGIFGKKNDRLFY